MVSFRSIKGPKVHEEIAKQIRQAIFSGRLRTGDKLPPERELASQLQTSRGAVREALRSLELAGLLVIKRGVKGGAFVAEFNSRPLSQSLSNMFRLGFTTIENVTEARLIIEPLIAGLAAESATDKDLVGMLEAIEEMQKIVTSGKFPRVYDIRFHRIVGEATKNPVLTFIIHAFMDFLRDTLAEHYANFTVEEEVVETHRQIYHAIKSRDKALAQDLMEKHVRDLHHKLRSLERKKLAP